MEATLPAVTAKIAEAEPFGILTEVGTLSAAVFELVIDTVTPFGPAGAVSVTLPVPDWLLSSTVGLTETLLKFDGGAFTVTVVAVLTPAYEAVTLTDVVVVTVAATKEKLADMEPWGIVTATGTLTAMLLELESDTEMPPAPATDVRLTVPVPD